MTPRTRQVFALLSRVDWPRALQRTGTLVRAIRGDSADEIAADTTKETSRGSQMLGVVETMARGMFGCVAPNRCNCPVCKETPP